MLSCIGSAARKGDEATLRDIKNFNDGWRFGKGTFQGAETNPVDELKPAVLPHTWYGDGDYYQGDACYQKVFTWKKIAGTRVFLSFDGVDKSCQVCLNGTRIGGHQGAYSTFRVDMTEALKDGSNLLTVLVNNEKGTDINPVSGDFTLFGGIYRDVKLIVTPQAHFDLTWYGTDGITASAVCLEDGTGKVNVNAGISVPEGMKANVRITLLDADGRCICQKMESIDEIMAGTEECCQLKNTGRMVLSVPEPVCWNGKESPYLYTVKGELVTENGIEDTVTLQTGFRRISIDPEHGFFLNGTHLKLNGVAKHQDTAGKFSAAGEEDWQKDLALILEIGANAVRLSHYQHPQRFYDLCDSSGLIVWAEIPMLRLLEKETLVQNARQQLTELVLQNMHHPSICFYGVENEIAMFGETDFMYKEVRHLHDLAKSLDPERFTAAANLNSVAYDSPLNHITDAVGYNLYFGWYYGEMPDFGSFLDGFHQANASVPLAVTEYGADCSPMFHSEHPKCKDYTEEFQALFHETVYPYLETRDYIWGSFVWNMFDFVSGVRDEGGVKYRNQKGLVTFDRQTRKDAFYYYKAKWSKEPFVHIVEKRFQNRTGHDMTVKVYSNCPSVVLKVQAREWSQSSSDGIFLFKNVPLSNGATQMKAAAGNASDTAVFFQTDEEDASYVFTDPNPGPNVKNWFVDEVERAKIFPEDRWSVMDVVNDLLSSQEAMAVIDSSYPQVGECMRDTVGTFTLEQVAAHMKTLISEENLKKLNETLICIRKK